MWYESVLARKFMSEAKNKNNKNYPRCGSVLEMSENNNNCVAVARGKWNIWLAGATHTTQELMPKIGFEHQQPAAHTSTVRSLIWTFVVFGRVWFPAVNGEAHMCSYGTQNPFMPVEIGITSDCACARAPCTGASSSAQPSQ